MNPILPDPKKPLILKFGGAAFHSKQDFFRVADLIVRKFDEHPSIVIVVSAMQEMTDWLIAMSHFVSKKPPHREQDMLLTVGERISMSLLSMCLADYGYTVPSFTGSQSGIITTSDHTQAKIMTIKPDRLIKALIEYKMIIVAGFQGVSLQKEITTLGRGGSDTTAVALAVALEAEYVEFFKNVDGVFDQDPNISQDPYHYPHLNYEEAQKIIQRTGGQILHPRALDLAKKNAISLKVSSFKNPKGRHTWITDEGVQSRIKVYETMGLKEACH